MKLFKIAALALVALGSAEVASAQTKIYITGSTAYRSSTHTAIMKLLGSTNGTSLPAGSSYGYTGGSLSGANAAIFKGVYNSANVTIKVSWSGSAGGVQTVAATNNNFTVGFLTDNQTTSQTGTSGLADPRATTAPVRDAQVPQVAFSDCYQSSTPFLGNFNGVAYSTLIDTIVGVIPFEWVKSKGAAAGITNMTPLLAQAQWVGTGTLPLAMYTGNATDQGTLVYATGRDSDSGTRTIALAESGIGVFTAIQQYNTGNETGGNAVLYPVQTVNGIVSPLGEGGENSGGTLAGNTRMGKTGLANSYVSYMGINDVGTLVGLGGGRLTWNGFSYSLTAVQQGQYSFWSYLHVAHKSSLSGTPLAFTNGLINQLLTVDGSPLLSSMNVVRGTDGGVITADY